MIKRKRISLQKIFKISIWIIIVSLIIFLLEKIWKTVLVWTTRDYILILIFIGFFIVSYALKWFIDKNGKQIFHFFISLWNSLKEAIRKNSEIKKLIKKHSVLFNFLQKRLNRRSFFGLPITVLSLILIYIVLLLAGIVKNVISSNAVVSTDIRVANLLSFFRDAKITKIFFWITLLGKWQVVLCFTLSIIIILWLWRKRSYILPLFLTIVGSEVFVFLGKIIIHRPRPELAVYTEDSFSFPSGHSAVAVAFYGFLAYLLIRNIKRWKAKTNLFFTGFVIVLLIGFSRLYLGVHYLSDVWGGYLIGLLWLILGIGISEWLLFIKTNEASLKLPIKNRIIPICLILISFSFYIILAINYHPRLLRPVSTNENVIIKNADNIFPNKELRYTETLTGNKQEPLSFIIFATNDKQFIKLFTNSGWFLADKINIFTMAKLAKSALLKQPYSKAPMTPSFWNRQVHHFGFEKPTKSDNVSQRHHARFWKTSYKTKDGTNIYVGTASLDMAIKWGLTHKINPDIDTEREYLFKDLKKFNNLMHFKKEKFVKPMLGRNFSEDLFFTDGQIYIITL